MLRTHNAHTRCSVACQHLRLRRSAPFARKYGATYLVCRQDAFVCKVHLCLLLQHVFVMHIDMQAHLHSVNVCDATSGTEYSMPHTTKIREATCCTTVKTGLRTSRAAACTISSTASVCDTCSTSFTSCVHTQVVRVSNRADQSEQVQVSAEGAREYCGIGKRGSVRLTFKLDS